METDFWRKLAKIGTHTHTPSFCALAFHNGRDDCNVDARVNIADGSTTSDKNLVNFGPVPRFCRLARVGYTLALPRISTLQLSVNCYRRLQHWRSTAAQVHEKLYFKRFYDR